MARLSSRLMLGIIVLAILGGLVWKLWTPALSFATGFKSLLERPTGTAGLWPFLRGVETVGGEYAGRPALLILHHKRGRNTLGYLVVAMQPFGGTEVEKKRAGAFREWIREPSAQAVSRSRPRWTTTGIIPSASTRTSSGTRGHSERSAPADGRSRHRTIHR